jgi:hypothetical protein
MRFVLVLLIILNAEKDVSSRRRRRLRTMKKINDEYDLILMRLIS